MKARCLNPKHPDFKHYGGRGIQVCSAWLKFAGFFASMGEMPEGLMLDRRDNNGNYEPENCRWISRIEQNRNKRVNVRYSLRGEAGTLGHLIDRFSPGLDQGTVITRMKRGLSLEEALTQPRYKRGL